jgi:hypothetical protein
MKKFTLFASVLFASNLAFGQLFTDDFESYAAGSYLGPQSTSWSTWSGTEGGTEDVKISTVQAQSGANSIYLASTAANGGPQDVILKFGTGAYNSGIFTLESSFFINAGKNGYFNIQGSQVLGNSYALNVNMDAGKVRIDDGSTPDLAVGDYTDATWFKLKIEANLSIHVWKAYVNDVLIGTWVNGTNTVASADFYPIQGSQFYMDDVSFDYQTYTLPSLNAMAADLNMGGEIATQTVAPKIKVLNAGQTALTSFDVDLIYNGTTYTQNVTGQNVASVGIYTVTMPNVVLAAGNNNATVIVYNVNGGSDDISSDDTLIKAINPVVPAPGKMVVSEEGTGTWCQWCPRGAVFMDQFNTKYQGYWVGIAVHNGDPITVTDYDAAFGNLISGYPSALVDRGTDVDPSGMTPDFFTRLQVAPKATLVNGATWDATSRTLNVSVTANFTAAANSNYKLACVLTEDDVTGTGSAYNQSNAYAGGGNGVMGGFETKPNPVPASQMVYDHVARAIAPSFDGFANSFPATVNAGDAHTLNFSFNLPTTWDDTQMHIVGLLIDPAGRIDNAGTATITEAVGNGFITGSNAGLFEANASQIDDDVKIYPNPATDNTNISLNLKNESTVEMQLVDVSGKVMAARNYGSLNGTWSVNLNTSNLNAGIYLVELTINGTKVTKRLIVE